LMGCPKESDRKRDGRGTKWLAKKSTPSSPVNNDLKGLFCKKRNKYRGKGFGSKLRGKLLFKFDQLWWINSL